MCWNRIKKIVACGGFLIALGACGPGDEAESSGDFSREGQPTTRGVPTVPELRPHADPEVPLDPEPSPTPSAASQTPSPVAPPNHSPTNPNGPQGPGLGPVLEGNPSLRTLQELEATGPNLSADRRTVGQSVDQSLPLQKVYAVLPLEYTAADGTQWTFDPLARIQPVEGSGTLRFVRGNPLLANAERFVEVRFQVRFPSRFVYNPATGYWGNSFATTQWLRFKLLACGADQRCRVLVEDIPAQTAPGNCVDGQTGCERLYQVRQDVTAFADHYKVLVEGTAAADFVDSQGYARLCSDSAQDCLYSHPFCVAGVCSAVARGGDYYEVGTPESLISGN